MSQGKVRIYGAGGLGNNIAKRYLGQKDVAGFATPLVSFIDTSRSNLDSSIPNEAIFVLEGTDGSGKVRRENHQAIADSIKQILLAQPPEDFNIVVFSASGGSGSVIGPLIVRELLERGKAVVVVSAGSAESTITAQNSLNTLKSLSAISNGVKVPVVAFYRHSGEGTTRSVIDGQLHFAITCLRYLASRQNAELDTMDVLHWLRFNKSTSVEPQLALLDIYSDAEKVLEILDPIAIASLYADRDQPQLQKPVPEYSCAGFFQTPVEGVSELHYVISTQFLGQSYDTLNRTVDQFIERREGRSSAKAIVTEKDQTTNDFLVL